MLSATYALSTDSIEENIKKDGANRLYWHANVRRLDIESLRDSALAVSGQLDQTIGGPAISIAVSAMSDGRYTVLSAVASWIELWPCLIFPTRTTHPNSALQRIPRYSAFSC